MKKIKKIILGSTISFASLAPIAISASCGTTIDSNEKKQQMVFLNDKARKEELENFWTENTISSLYKIDLSKDQTLYQKTINDKQSSLFKDAFKIFKLYWKSKINTDKQYFLKKEVDWKTEGVIFYEYKENKLTPTKSFSIKEIGDQEPTEDQFLILWNTAKTQIKKEVEKFILVDKYLAIENIDELKKIDKEYEKNSKEYVSKNYNLLKYVISKKPSQLWLGSSTNESGIAGKLQYNPSIKGVEDFNSYVQGDAKDKKLNLENIVDLEKISELSEDKTALEKLMGYQGIIFGDETKYGLNWDKKTNLEHSKPYVLGYYQPVLGSLITATELKKNQNGYLVKSGNTTIIAYLIQILPIAKSIKEKDKDGKEIENKKFTFEGSIFEKHLDNLSYLLYLKDSSLIETAKQAFYSLGYLIELKNEDLKKLYKDEKFVKKD